MISAEGKRIIAERIDAGEDIEQVAADFGVGEDHINRIVAEEAAGDRITHEQLEQIKQGGRGGYPPPQLVFRRKNAALAERAGEILEDEHPMTLRQLFYRLVSAGDLQNKPSEYQRLGGVMTRLREAGEVPMTWIVDHLRATLKPSSWSGLADFGDTVRDAYRKDFWASLPDHVEVFVEKDAVAGTIQPVTDKYDIALRVCRGYSSVSFAGEGAEQWSRITKPIHAYYLGDFDPSGFDIERDLRRKLTQYTKGEVDYRWERLAIQKADFGEFDLIQLPAKRTDRRYAGFVKKHGHACAELDALPPTELRERVEDAIVGHIDEDEWERLQNIEAVEQEAMDGYLDQWNDVKVDLA
jgi:hypothetical protein